MPLSDGDFICELLKTHGKGMYRKDLITLVSDITPHGHDEIMFQYLGLIYSGALVEIQSKVYNKGGSFDL